MLMVVATQQPTELDMTFMMTMQRLVGVALLDVEYLMAIDTDTRVSKAIKLFMHKMDKDKSVLACCGETRVDNESQSFTTMIQEVGYSERRLALLFRRWLLRSLTRCLCWWFRSSSTTLLII